MKYALSFLPVFFFSFYTGLSQNLNLPQAPRAAVDASQSGGGHEGIQQKTPAPTVIWTEDFASGIPSTWAIDDQSGICPWKYSTVGSYGYFNGNYPNAGTAIASTTSGNGFIINDPDSANQYTYGQPSGSNYQYLSSYITTDAINCSSYPAVVLTFEQYFRFNNGIDLEVYVSNDSINWTMWTAQGSITNNTASANPDLYTLNISSVAGNQPTVYLRFGWSARVYFWMIDDITLSSAPNNELAINEVYYADVPTGVEYIRTPIQQAKSNPYVFKTAIVNNGGLDQTGVNVDVSVTRDGCTDYQSNINYGTMTTGTADTVIFSPSFDPCVTGMYQANFTLSSDSVDATPANNVDSTVFYITDTVYARDPGAPTGGWWNTSGCAYEIGNMYEIFTAQTLTSVSIWIHSNTDVSAGNVIVYPVVYDISSASFVWAGQGPDYVVQQSDINNGFITLTMGTPVALNANTPYVVCIGFYGSTAPEEFVIASAGSVPAQTAFLQDIPDCQGGGANTWYYVTTAPMVRANFSTNCTPYTVTSTIIDATCGANDGTASVAATGGAQPYCYAWPSTAGCAGTNQALNLGAGSYTVTVTDANGCSETHSVNVNNVGGASISTTTITNVLCNGDCTGAVDITVSGGTSPYSFQWDDSGNSTTEDVTMLCAGNYNVTVTDASACQSVQSATITEPTLLSASAVEDACASSGTAADGQATVTASGGTTAYTYAWDSGETTQSATGLTGGSHTVTVTDNNGCTTTTTLSICITGVEDILHRSQIHIYPIPAGDHVNIKFDNVPDGMYVVNVISMVGQMVYSEEKFLYNGTIWRLSTGTIAKGVYVLSVEHDGTSIRQQLLIR